MVIATAMTARVVVVAMMKTMNPKCILQEALEGMQATWAMILIRIIIKTRSNRGEEDF
jgi:hypothetical protein